MYFIVFREYERDSFITILYSGTTEHNILLYMSLYPIPVYHSEIYSELYLVPLSVIANYFNLIKHN